MNLAVCSLCLDSISAKETIEKNLLTPNLTKDKSIIQRIIKIHDLSAQSRGFQKERNEHSTQVDKLNERITEKSRSTEQLLIDFSRVVTQEINQQSEAIFLDPNIFVEEGKNASTFRSQMAENLKKLKFLYCFDPIDTLPSEFASLVPKAPP